MPFFQAPDELAHIDYALELYAVGKPFVVPRAQGVHVASPVLRYVQIATHYRENRYNPAGKLPANYGTAAFFSDVDANAPRIDTSVPPPGSQMPYVMFFYPAGYYALAALAMKLAAFVHPNSIVALIFGARMLSIGCLVATLSLCYGTFLRLRLPRSAALLATVAIGWLPLTSWVSGYVQPDNLTTLLVTASLYVTLRWREQPERLRWLGALCAILVALAFVKQHYAVATIGATLATGIATVRSRRALRTMFAGFTLPVAAAMYAGRLVPVAHIASPQLPGQQTGLLGGLASPAALGASIVDGLKDIYGGGDAFMDFWMRFGIRGSTIYTGALRRTLTDLLVAVTILTACAIALRTYAVMKRVAIVARRRSVPLAARMLLGNVMLNAYVAVTTILLGVYVASHGNVWLEGRYWLPVIVPTIALGTAIVPRLVRAGRRRFVAIAFASLWVSYAAVSAPVALAALDRSYYHQPQTHATSEPYAQVMDVRPAGTCAAASSPAVSISPGCTLDVTGYAVDSERGLPARTVYLQIDGGPSVRAQTGRKSEVIRDLYNDDALMYCGFRATLDTTRYAAGSHTITVLVVERRAPHGLRAQATTRFDLRAPGGPDRRHD